MTLCPQMKHNKHEYFTTVPKFKTKQKYLNYYLNYIWSRLLNSEGDFMLQEFKMHIEKKYQKNKQK